MIQIKEIIKEIGFKQMIKMVNILGERSDEGMLAKWPKPETKLLPGAFYHFIIIIIVIIVIIMTVVIIIINTILKNS